MGEEELAGPRNEGPPTGKQQPRDRPSVHPHADAHFPQEPAHLLERRAQEEDIVPGQNQGGDFGEPAARRGPGRMRLRGRGGGGSVRHHDFPQGVHGDVQVLHPLPLPAVDLPPQLQLLLGTQLLLGLGNSRAALQAEERCRGQVGVQTEPWGAVGQVVHRPGATER